MRRLIFFLELCHDFLVSDVSGYYKLIKQIFNKTNDSYLINTSSICSPILVINVKGNRNQYSKLIITG